MHTRPLRVLAAILAVACLGWGGVCRAQPFVIFTTDTTIASGNLQYDGYAISVLGCTLTIDGPHTFHALRLYNNNGVPAVVTTSPQVPLELTILTDLTVGDTVYYSPCRIDVSGKGYPAGAGPGAGQYIPFATHAGGAGHGGTGDNSASPVGLGGWPYGDPDHPTTFGSGGGNPGVNGFAGGSGGGAVRLIVHGTFTIGAGSQIDASGLYGAGSDNQGSDTGGGAGGSIWITALNYDLYGGLFAVGGAQCCSYSGAGAGGRIRLDSCQAMPSGIELYCIVHGGWNTTDAGTISVGSVPLGFDLMPRTVVAESGSTVQFSVAAHSAFPITYAWRRGNEFLVDGPRVAGATTPNLQISGVSIADIGDVYCQIGGAAGVAGNTGCADLSSPVAYLYVGPAFVQHPTRVSVPAGSTAVYTVAVDESNPYGYRWRRDGVMLSDSTTPSGMVVSGSETNTLTLSSVALSDSGAAFDCIVYGHWGTIRSNPAGLAVTGPAQPVTGACCFGAACTSTNGTAACAGEYLGNGSLCAPPARGGPMNACCRADFNASGSLAVQDIFLFLNAWFAGCP